MGCEDPRVTFVPLLERYVMAYTAFGPAGPRIVFALSPDGYAWDRLGRGRFRRARAARTATTKTRAFFPEPVRSPAGVLSLAFYHRPMRRISTAERSRGDPDAARAAGERARVHAHRLRPAERGASRRSQLAASDREPDRARAGRSVGSSQDGRRNAAGADRRRLALVLSRGRRARSRRPLRDDVQRRDRRARRRRAASAALSFAAAGAGAVDGRRIARDREQRRVPDRDRRARRAFVRHLLRNGRCEDRPRVGRTGGA